VLSHALLVEAIESLFDPIVIYNNKKGEDAEILKRYKEPAWNNPAVRFLDREGKDLIPRKGGVYSVSGIARRMARALRAAGKKVPEYLRLLGLPAAGSKDAKYLRKASFAMY